MTADGGKYKYIPKPIVVDSKANKIEISDVIAKINPIIIVIISNFSFALGSFKTIPLIKITMPINSGYIKIVINP